ncbi:MAG: L,D-transpeptidase family protein [Candidatus Magasanikbacteria bacterium]|nr:L,D-transpeptidase family protein [Candidatus Magasanikbacteria bacterium]
MKRLFLSFFILFFFVALPVKAANLDSDSDGLSDADEINIYHTDAQLADTDGDGFSDGIEIANGFSPLVAGKKLKEIDTDSDELTDAQELTLGTDLGYPDTDKDGFFDGLEVRNGFDPLTSGLGKIDKKIEVDLKTQKLVYFFGEKKMFLISSGIKRLSTPMGEFNILQKKPIVNYKGFDYYLPNTKWNLLFTRNAGGIGYFIHGAYWHNKFGQPMSHGCVNVAYKDMEDLYNFAQVGTQVVIR